MFARQLTEYDKISKALESLEELKQDIFLIREAARRDWKPTDAQEVGEFHRCLL